MMSDKSHSREHKQERKPAERIILFTEESNEVRVAILENGVLEEFYMERSSAERQFGNIYKGIVRSIVPGIQAAFVNIGTSRDGFLHVDDALKSPIEHETGEGKYGLVKDVRDERGGREKRVRVEDILKIGQEIIVQVVKEPIRSKGARLTTKFSIPGRYIVMMPGDQRLGISRRIEDPQERSRLKEISKDLEVPEGTGLIIRTVGVGKTKKEFLRDVQYLLRIWKEIQRNISKKRAPSLIYEELGLVERTIRDHFTEETRKIIVDKKELLRKVKSFIRTYLPGFHVPIELHREKVPLFEKYRVEAEIEKAFHKIVELPCGGHIVIEQTEGLVSIDVNTGKFTQRRSLEETVYKTNCEAALEVARQVRLRDMGGIIIIDFIDMENERHRHEVFRIFREAVRKDRAKTNILKISELGLVEMTRQRVRPSLESAIYDSCPYCEGRGFVKSVATMSIRALKDARKKLSDTRHKWLNLRVHPQVADRLMTLDKKALKMIERETWNKIVVLADPSLHVEDIQMELEERKGSFGLF